METSRRLTIGIGICLTIILLLAPFVGAQTKEFKIGYIGPLSGGVAFVGEQMLYGAEVAADVINEQGGVKVAGQRYNIKIVKYDDGMDPSKSTAGLRRLKDLEGITIMTGFLGSPCSMAAHTLNEKLGVLIFNTQMSCKITNDGNKLAVTYGVPGHWTGYAQGKAMAEQGFKTACMVVDVADGPQEWANSLQKSFEDAGGKILIRENIATVQADWYSIMTRFKSKNPDLIIPWAYEEGQCKAILAAREIGYNGRMHISWNVSPRTPQMLGIQKAEGLMWVGELSDYRLMNLADDKIGRITAFANRFKAKYGRLPHTLSLGFHDSIWAVAKACEEKNTLTDVNAIRATLGKVFQEGKFQVRYDYKDVLSNGLVYVESMGLFEMRNGKSFLLKDVTPSKELLGSLPEELKKK